MDATQNKNTARSRGWGLSLRAEQRIRQGAGAVGLAILMYTLGGIMEGPGADAMGGPSAAFHQPGDPLPLGGLRRPVYERIK